MYDLVNKISINVTNSITRSISRKYVLSFLRNLLNRAENDPDEVAECFRRVAERIFTRNNMLVNVTSEAEDYKCFEGKVSELMERFPDKPAGSALLSFDEPIKNSEAVVYTSS